VFYFCCDSVTFSQAFRVGIDVRVALNALIFEKALTLKTTHMMRTTTGQVINLVSNDSAKAEDLCIYLPYIWNCPMEIAIVLGLLYRQVGVAAFAGFGAILFLTPMQLWFSRLFGQYRRYTVQRTDMRVKTINEILIGADVMKMMNWENSLEEKVNAVRQEEFDSISRAARLKSINQAAFFASMAVVNLVTFATMWARGDTFTPADVFGATAFFNIIKFPLCNLSVFKPGLLRMWPCGSHPSRMLTLLIWLSLLRQHSLRGGAHHRGQDRSQAHHDVPRAGRDGGARSEEV
jgi:ATP-binding cassette subfamily C (CFTR/MRP) protein 4